MSILSTASSFIGLNKWYFLAGAILLAFASGGYLGWHERVLREPAMLTAQKNADVKACGDVQAKTKEQNDDLTKDRDRIAADAARYKRLHRSECLFLSNDGKLLTNPGQYAGMHGISTEWLRDYAAVCETYRSELMVCTGQKNPS